MDVPLRLQELVVAVGVAVVALVVAIKALRDSKFGRCTSMPLGSIGKRAIRRRFRRSTAITGGGRYKK